MSISMLKYIKVLRHVSILTDRHQGVGLYLVVIYIVECEVHVLVFVNY